MKPQDWMGSTREKWLKKTALGGSPTFRLWKGEPVGGFSLCPVGKEEIRSRGVLKAEEINGFQKK